MLTAINRKYPLGFGPRDIDEQWLPVTDFVEKPVEPAVLRGKVAALLRGADQGGSGGEEKAEQEHP